MQGIKTSKIMRPCEHGVHLHKSASFETIFEQNLTNHKKNAKLDPKMIEISI